jgi:uncharacterized protein YlxW (UPF0749 family)
VTQTQRTGGDSVALLIDLVTNTLDPGYAQAAERRAPVTPRRRQLDRVAISVGCALIGLTLAIAYVSTHRAAPETAKVQADLVARVRAAQSAADQLEQDAQGLNSKVNNLRNSALGGSNSLRTQLELDQVLSGAVAVTGPGVIVSLSNPPSPTASPTAGRAGATPIGATQLLTDRDVRSVVNELWAVGAEAISVNNIRLTPTSSIRFAGEAVLVDFEPISPPYLVSAIGNSDRLDTGFAASAVASRYQTLSSVDGVGFSFDERTRLALPASTVPIPTYAHPIGPTPATTGSSSPAPSSTGASR